MQDFKKHNSRLALLRLSLNPFLTNLCSKLHKKITKQTTTNPLYFPLHSLNSQQNTHKNPYLTYLLMLGLKTLPKGCVTAVMKSLTEIIMQI